MLLYLIRHAEAEPASGTTTRDFDRPLTEQGRRQVAALADALRRRGVVLDAVATSPLVRAYQTASELIAALNSGLRPVTCDELAVDRLRPSKLSDWLAQLTPRGVRMPTRADKAVAAVGHMPDLGQYLEWLIGAAPGSVALAKAGAACLRFPSEPARGSGQLLWLVTPEWYL